MFDLLRRLTYTKAVRRLARTSRLHKSLRSAYFRLAAPGGRARVTVGGFTAEFSLSNSAELRRLEGPSHNRNVASSERASLEFLVAAVHPGDVVYDIGANVGLYSMLLSKAVGPSGQVIAFEPDSRNAKRLNENALLNGLTNFRCFRKALGEANHSGALYLRDDDPYQSTLLAHLPPDERSSEEVVDVVAGDDFRIRMNLPIPRAVKIDVEGSELNVIRGLGTTLAKEACQFVLCEIHPHLLPMGIPDQIVKSLTDYGFRGIKLHSTGLVQHAIGSKVSGRTNDLAIALAGV
jgi:FkbM family methyltransferase